MRAQTLCLLAFASGGVLLAGMGQAAAAQIQFDQIYLQNAPTSPTSIIRFDIVLSALTQGTPFDGGTVLTPGPAGTVTFAPGFDANNDPELAFSDRSTNGTTFVQTYPNGTYIFNLTDSHDSTQNQSVSVLNNSNSIFPPIPALTAGTFNSLSTYDPTQPFTFNFNQSNPGTLGFFDIVTASNFQVVFFDPNGVQPTQTQETVPANTLQPGVNYLAVLFFTSNTFPGPDPTSQLSLDSQTRIAFTTEGGASGVAPEPGGALLCGGVALLWVLRRRFGRCL